MKRILALVLVLATVLAMSVSFASCKNNGTDEENSGANTDKESTGEVKTPSDVKIGLIMVGDESEGYTLAHMDGINAAAKELGLENSLIWKKVVHETSECADAAKELIASGCTLIISNSYGHQDFMAEVASENENITFVAATGDYAAISGLDNFNNAFTDVYESRYVSGVIAGMKIAELIADGKLTADNYDGENVKIGYVGAYPYAEVVSGYTAFFLGIKSIVSNVTMMVQYTNEWFDYEAEGATAEALMAKGCVVIGQHADSKGAPTAIEAAHANGKVAYSVGYNVDMLDVAPTAALTSATNNWGVYYKALFTAFLNGQEIPKDWSEGFNSEAVGVTTLGSSCAAGTAEKVAEVIAAIKDGTLHVFDTSTFTVNGEHLTSYKASLSYMDFATMTPIYEWTADSEAIATDSNGVSYFNESVLRSAPYFDIRIDGITEIAAE